MLTTGGLPSGIQFLGWKTGGRHSPLQGLSSSLVPLHRNWSVTTSLTSVKLGNVFLSWETTLIQLVHCSRGRTGEKNGMSRPRGHLVVQLGLGGEATQGQMEKAARAGGGRETVWEMPQRNPISP